MHSQLWSKSPLQCWEVTCTPCGCAEIACKAVNVTRSSLSVLLRRPFPALPRLSLLSGRGRGVNGLALLSQPHPRPGEFMPAGPGHSPQSHSPRPSHWVSKPSLGLGEDRASEHSRTLKGPLSKRCLAVGQAGRSSHSHLPVCSPPHTTELVFLVTYVPTAGGKPPAGWPGLVGAAACCSPFGDSVVSCHEESRPSHPQLPRRCEMETYLLLTHPES